jgi:hypothetical protein
VRLVGSRTALSPVAILVMGLALHGNVLRGASIAVPLLGLSLHRHALRMLSIARFGIHTELLLQKGQLLVEPAPCLRKLIKPSPLLGIGTTMARSRLRFGAA